jgi:hypothetical protein
MGAKIIEVVTFRTVEGIDEHTVLAAAEAVMPWLRQQPGFIERNLSVNEDGEWLDRATWRDQASAMTAGQQIMSAQSAAAFMGMIIPETMVMRHFEIKLES